VPVVKGKDFTPTEIQGLIDESGFPFEVSVARVLLDLGFAVEPSHRIYDPSRGKDVEIDISATFTSEEKISDGNAVTSAIRIGVECKDSSMPYVFFGLPHVDEKRPGSLDPDWPYVHINTSRDLHHPNRYGMGLFARDRADNSIKSIHHHFSESHRYRVATQVDCKGNAFNGPFKLHVSDAVVDATRKLARFVTAYHETWQAAMKSARDIVDFETMLGGRPYFGSCFTLVVHNVPHYRYLGDGGGPIEKLHTPVFLAHSSEKTTEYFVVDFVSLQALRSVVDAIKRSHRSMLDRVIGGLLRDQGIASGHR
jgi:hypothetical protein